MRGFLETLSEEERKAYTLTDTINDAETANSIETFFVERAKQLLKSGGVAAIILPSSILSNGGTTYIRAREILLQYFDIVAIAEFGSGTFGKTGTNTVTLFLRRKPTQPDTAEHYRERVEEWFKDCATSKHKQAIYKDGHLIEQYCTHINVPLADYQSLLRGETDGSWKQQAHFQSYHDKFDKSSELANLRKQRKFKALSETEQTAEIAKRYLAYVQTIERDKLYHFCLALDQTNPVLIIRSPSGTKEIKQFLGYDWSSAKGDEGIKLIEDAAGRHITTLYDGPDHANPMRFTRDNPAKLNSHIAANFDGTLGAIPDELSEVANPARLVDILDFSRAVFEKQLSLSVNKKIEVVSKWPLKKIGQITKILNGGTPDTKNVTFWENGNICWATLVDTKEKYLRNTQRKITEEGLKATTLLPVNTVIFSSRATIGEVCINKVPTATNQGYKNFICDPEQIDYEYLYYLLMYLRPVLENLVPTGSKYKEINTQQIANFEIPLPPIEIQNKIISECEAVEQQVEKTKSDIERFRAEIEKLTIDFAKKTFPTKKLSEITSKIGSGATPKGGESSYKETGIALIRSQNIYDNFFKEKGLAFIDEEQAKLLENVTVEANDLLLNITGASVARCYPAPEKHLPARVNQHVAIIRPKSDILNTLYLHRILISPSYKNRLLGLASGGLSREAITKSQLEEFKIPVPPLPEQKKFVVKVEALEKQIAEAQAVIDAAPARKAAVMKKYL